MKKQLFDKIFWSMSAELGFCHSMLQEQSNCSHSSFGVEFCWIFYSSFTLIFCLSCATAVTLLGTRWLLKFWICSLTMLDMTPTEKLYLLKSAIKKKNIWKRDSSPFLVPCLPESLAVETVKPKTWMLCTQALGCRLCCPTNKVLCFLLCCF